MMTSDSIIYSSIKENILATLCSKSKIQLVDTYTWMLMYIVVYWIVIHHRESVHMHLVLNETNSVYSHRNEAHLVAYLWVF